LTTILVNPRLPGRTTDRLSASYLIALGARIVREVGTLWRAATRLNKRLATLAIDTEIRFAAPSERAAFTADLTRGISTLVARYHDASAPGGRMRRLVVVAHPTPPVDEDREEQTHASAT
jgi:hypothetical protein